MNVQHWLADVPEDTAEKLLVRGVPGLWQIAFHS
jgi:hypothetical protein